MNLFQSLPRCNLSYFMQIAIVIFVFVIYININVIGSLQVDNRAKIEFELQKSRSENKKTSQSNIDQKINNITDIIVSNNTPESGVIQKVIYRATASLETCSRTPHTNDFTTKQKLSNASLPEFGVINALSGWLMKSDSFKKHHNMHSKSVNWVHNLQCALPPEKSCNVEGFTVIFMSYTLTRINGLLRGINKVAGWKNTREIILVWNSDRNILDESQFAQVMKKYHDDPSHPLRIFYALDNGLENNLFNRYHPLISPKMEAILYFDDDGPFFDEEAMVTGFELWKRDSGRQVGCFPRNIRFKSDRMIKQGITEIEKSINWIIKGSSKSNLEDQQKNDERPEFIATCQKAAGDKLEYNYHIFAQYQAHILLPSGSFIHRNFLCWLWHPGLEEARQFVLDHPTHPGKYF